MSIIGDTPSEHRRHIPSPSFLGEWFMGPENARVMREAGELVLGVWQGIVAVQTGALKASGRVELNLGGLKNDRICADVIIGAGTPRGGYGESHEFGIGIHPRSTGRGWIPQQPVDDFVKALAIVDSMTK